MALSATVPMIPQDRDAGQSLPPYGNQARICSWCSEVISAIRPFCFLTQEPENATHGICPACFNAYREDKATADGWKSLREAHLGHVTWFQLLRVKSPVLPTLPMPSVPPYDPLPLPDRAEIAILPTELAALHIRNASHVIHAYLTLARLGAQYEPVRVYARQILRETGMGRITLRRALVELCNRGYAVPITRGGVVYWRLYVTPEKE